MEIKFEAKFPIEWGRIYYTVEVERKQTFAPCTACDNTGKITIKGEKYTCPRCHGDWRKKEVTGTKQVFSLGKWVLSEVQGHPAGGGRTAVCLTFRRDNAKTTGGIGGYITVRQAEFDTMIAGTKYGTDGKQLYFDQKEAMAEVKRLNKLSRTVELKRSGHTEQEAAGDGD